MALAGIFLAGMLLVAFSWNARDLEALSPSFDDHWHVSYGIYDCRTESFQPNLPDPQTPNSGMHTHGQGVVHIHPRGSDVTGNNAQLGRFLEAARVEITDSRVTFTDREELSEEGAVCGGEPAILQVVSFPPGQDTIPEVRTEDLGSYRFQADQERVVIALAPEGAVIPPPPQANVDLAAQSSPNIFQTDGVNDLSIPGLAGFDEDGNAIGADGELILDADGNPQNVLDLVGAGDNNPENGDGDDDDDEDDAG